MIGRPRRSRDTTVRRQMPLRPGAQRRPGQRGMTLIEVMVALALVATAITFLVGSMANAQKIGTVAQNESIAETSVRYVYDYLRVHHTPTPPPNPAPDCDAVGCRYILCEGTKWATGSYSVRNPPAPAPALSANPITSVIFSTSATRDGTAVPPLQDCTNGNVAPSSCIAGHMCDWGVQEIKITQTSAGIMASRTVWKSRP